MGIRKDKRSGAVNVVASVNTGEKGQSTHVSSHQRIVQRGDEVTVEESTVKQSTHTNEQRKRS